MIKLGEDKIMITGGSNFGYQLRSTEIISKDGVTFGPDLPRPVAKHCALKVRYTITNTILL